MTEQEGSGAHLHEVVVRHLREEVVQHVCLDVVVQLVDDPPEVTIQCGESAAQVAPLLPPEPRHLRVLQAARSTLVSLD
jgi:hypothetical protein